MRQLVGAFAPPARVVQIKTSIAAPKNVR